MKHGQIKALKQVTKGLSKVTKSIRNMLTKMKVCGANNWDFKEKSSKQCLGGEITKVTTTTPPTNL